MIYHDNTNYKIAWVNTLMSNREDFSQEKLSGIKRGIYIMIKGFIPKEDIIILNACAPNRKASK